MDEMKPKILFFGDSWTKSWAAPPIHYHMRVFVQDQESFIDTLNNFTYGDMFSKIGFEAHDLGIPGGCNLGTISRLQEASASGLFGKKSVAVIFQTETMRNHLSGTHNHLCDYNDLERQGRYECLKKDINKKRLTYVEFLKTVQKDKRDFYESLCKIANKHKDMTFFLIGGCSRVDNVLFKNVAKINNCKNIQIPIVSVNDFLFKEISIPNRPDAETLKLSEKIGEATDLTFYSFETLLEYMDITLIEAIEKQCNEYWTELGTYDLKNQYFFPDAWHPNDLACRLVSYKLIDEIFKNTKLISKFFRQKAS